jgi:CBS-domain-containing membrane protein
MIMKPDDSIEQALLQFAQSPDREAVVVNDGGQLIGTIAVLDLILASAPPEG